MRRVWAVYVLVTMLAFGACGVGTDNLVLPGQSTAMARLGEGVQPMCQAGCWDEDPFPDSVGVFLNSYVTPDQCSDPEQQTDTDQDGLSDFCEERIAAGFAPILYYDANDDVTGEPRYVIQHLDVDSVVRILYLPSYYWDFGGGSCPYLNPFSLPWYDLDPCDGHFGDSESLTLDVRYNSATQHWILGRAWFSQHTGYGYYHSQSNNGLGIGNEYPTSLTYPDHPGGAPLVFVAVLKHAGYATDNECDAGGTLGSDDCTSDSYYTLPTEPIRNIGSYDHQALDCVDSYNPAYIYSYPHYQECYWSGEYFTGWSGAYPAAAGYVARLYDWGFMPY